MRPIRIKVTPAAANAALIAASQTKVAAGNLVLTAAAAGPLDPQTGQQGLVGSNGLGRIITLTSSGNDSGISATITGVSNGQVTSETISALGNIAAVSSTKYYTSVTSISLSAAAAANIQAGITNTTASASLGVIPLDFYGRTASIVSVDVSGTISYTVQMTFDDCLANTSINSNVYFATPANPTALTAQSSSAYDALPAGVNGILVTIPTYSTGGSITVNVIAPSNSNLG